MLRLGMTLFLLTSGLKQSYFVFQAVLSLDPCVMQVLVHQELHFAGMTRITVDLFQIVCAAALTSEVRMNLSNALYFLPRRPVGKMVTKGQE